MFNKIVVGIDGSGPSDNAVATACDLANKYGAELHLVHAPQPQTVAFAMGAMSGYHAATTMPSAAEVKQAADVIIKSGKDVAAKHNGTVTDTHVSQGNPADQIANYAKECGADLIVTGRRCLGSVGARLQGSTSQAINHQAKCACLSVE